MVKVETEASQPLGASLETLQATQYPQRRGIDGRSSHIPSVAENGGFGTKMV